MEQSDLACRTPCVMPHHNTTKQNRKVSIPLCWEEERVKRQDRKVSIHSAGKRGELRDKTSRKNLSLEISWQGICYIKGHTLATAPVGVTGLQTGFVGPWTPRSSTYLQRINIIL